MAELPMVLITEILVRLPVKYLVRFRCVSKPWDSLIKDPLFINLHLKHSLATHTNQTLIIRDSYLHSLDFPALSSVTLIDHPLESDGRGTELLGSCNGLLCLSNGDIDGIDDTIFYNPATRRHHVLPACDIEFPDNDDCFTCCDRTVYGFGYDHVNDDYKLVRVIQFTGDDEFDSEVKVYSLKSGSWGRIHDFPREYYLSYKRAWGNYVNGFLHWVVTRNPESDGTKLIIAFDLGSEEYKIVSQPEYSGGEFHMNVDVLKGCLCVLCNYVDVKTDVWVMEEYGVQNSWTKLFSIAQGDIIGIYEYVRPLACSKEGSRVLVEQDGKSLFWFDLETQTIENVEIVGLPRLLDTEMMVESLVPLECSQRKVKPKVKKVQPKLKEKKSKQKRDDDMNSFLSKGFKLKL
ncbi:F-box protein CPR1-like [Silene latifolia]|uniref:F-box protein CPR1-like n=1 Tax=Silene latifolia TaxID=37657 RepID=UPI003D76F1F0